jgi:hypothetical protein
LNCQAVCQRQRRLSPQKETCQTVENLLESLRKIPWSNPAASCRR